MIDKILVLVRRGYGLTQLMDDLELTNDAVLELMEKDNSFKNKMLKRFSDDWLRGEEVPTAPNKPEEPKSIFDGLSLDELKKRADIVGLAYNANIKEKSLTEKLDKHLEANPEKKALLEPVVEDDANEGGDNGGQPE